MSKLGVLYVNKIFVFTTVQKVYSWQQRISRKGMATNATNKGHNIILRNITIPTYKVARTSHENMRCSSFAKSSTTVDTFFRQCSVGFHAKSLVKLAVIALLPHIRYLFHLNLYIRHSNFVNSIYFFVHQNSSRITQNTSHVRFSLIILY